MVMLPAIIIAVDGQCWFGAGAAVLLIVLDSAAVAWVGNSTGWLARCHRRTGVATAGGRGRVAG